MADNYNTYVHYRCGKSWLHTDSAFRGLWELFLSVWVTLEGDTSGYTASEGGTLTQTPFEELCVTSIVAYSG